MFCKNCGAENNDESKFCKGCGEELNKSASNKKEEDNSVQYTIKPTYNWGYKVLTVGLSSLLVGIFIVLYAIGEFDMDTLIVLSAFYKVVIVGILIYVGLRLFFEKLQYDKLEYNFYKNKVEYKDGFLNVSEKELKYKHIREITMTQNILERIFKIGTIRVFTNASSGRTNYNRRNNMQGQNGVIIHCVTNVKEQYSKVKEIIDECTEE